jgi:hypothetical protein
MKASLLLTKAGEIAGGASSIRKDRRQFLSNGAMLAGFPRA